MHNDEALTEAEFRNAFCYKPLIITASQNANSDRFALRPALRSASHFANRKAAARSITSA